MKKIILALAIIILSTIVSTNISFSQWNKVNEHFELQRAKNTKILSYTTYEEDNNLIVIDETGEINEYKMDTGELTKTCNCIKDSTFEYAQLLEDKEIVVLGKKYVDSLILNKYATGFYSYELFFVNKSKCELIAQKQLPLDNYLYNRLGTKDYSINYNLNIFKSKLDSLKQLSIIFNFDYSYYNMDQRVGSETEGSIIIEYDLQDNISFKKYSYNNKFIFDSELKINKYKKAIILNDYGSNSSEHRFESTKENKLILIDTNNIEYNTLNHNFEVIDTDKQPSKPVRIEKGYYTDIYQVTKSYNPDNIFIRIRDSIKVYNVVINKFETPIINSKVQKNIIEFTRYPYYITQNQNSIQFYNYNEFQLLEEYKFLNENISNVKLINNDSNLILRTNTNKIIKKECDILSIYPKNGFVISDKISYTNTNIYFTALTKDENCQFFWYVNGLEYITNNIKQTIQLKDTGVFDVKLKVLTSDKKVIEYEQKKILTIREQLVADFSYEIDKNDPRLVYFTNLSKGKYTNIKWLVTNSNNSFDELKETKHKFPYFGDFSVTLEISDNLNTFNTTKIVNLTNTLPELKNNEKTIENLNNNFNIKSFLDILTYNNQRILIDKIVFDPNDQPYPTIKYSHNYYFLDNSLKLTKTLNNCLYKGEFSSNTNSSFILFPNQKLLYTQFFCYSSQNFSGVLYDGFNDFNKYTILKNDIFNNIDDRGWYYSKKMIFTSDNKSRFYSLVNSSDSTDRLTKSDFEFNDYSKIQLKNIFLASSNKYVNSVSKISCTNENISVVQDYKYHFDIYLFDKDLNQMSYKKMDKDTSFVVSDVKLIGDENIFIFGNINYKNIVSKDNYQTNYGAIYKYNFDKQILTFKDFYSRANIKQIEVINDKYIAVSGDTRSLQGYMILDYDLNLEKDIRYENLSGEYRKMFLNKDTIEIYSGSLNYIKDTIDDYIVLGANGYQDKSEINIYPNPASDIATIDLSSFKQTNNEIIISAYDIMGNKVANLFSGIYNNKYIEVDTRVLPIGNFMIVVSDGNQIISKQIAIMR